MRRNFFYFNEYITEMMIKLFIILLILYIFLSNNMLILISIIILIIAILAQYIPAYYIANSHCVTFRTPFKTTSIEYDDIHHIETYVERRGHFRFPRFKVLYISIIVIYTKNKEITFTMHIKQDLSTYADKPDTIKEITRNLEFNKLEQYINDHIKNNS